MALRAPLMRHQHDEEKGQPDVHLSPQEYAKMEIPYETDNRTSLGEFYKLTDEQLKETIKYRIEQMRKGGSELGSLHAVPLATRSRERGGGSSSKLSSPY